MTSKNIDWKEAERCILETKHIIWKYHGVPNFYFLGTAVRKCCIEVEIVI